MTTTTVLAGSNIQVRIAKLPTDLNDIRDCRKSAYANKAINLPAAKSFCNADQITREGYVCVIATDDRRSRGNGAVLGTADALASGLTIVPAFRATMDAQPKMDGNLMLSL